ncbi:MAG TPA: hypothetical protein VN954_02090 [Ktedonobacteraceae bacterium]|nr:hypothetical protein [Ktedonobacteraceae bacterium]
MNTILIALAFVGGLVGLILVGMMVTMYFYTHGALGLTRFRGAKGLQALAARSVPFQVTLGAGESEINLGLSTDPGARYARGSMLVMAIVLLMLVVAVISVLSATIH